MADEIGALVVRIMGDVKPLVSSLQKAVTEITNAATVMNAQMRKVEDETKKVKGTLEQLSDVAKNAANAFATIGIGTNIMNSFFDWERAELGQKRLAMAIDLNGGAVKETVAEYKKFAGEIAAITTSSRGATYSLLQTAQMMGLTAQQTEAATRNAIALAAQTGGEASSYIRQTGLLEKGYVSRSLGMQLGLPMKQMAADANTAQQAFDEMGNAIEPMEKDAAKAAQAHERLAKMFELAKIEGQSTAAQLERTKKVIAGLTKDVGGLLAEGLRPAISGLESFVRWFNSLDPVVRKTVVATAALTGGFVALANIVPLVTSQWDTMKKSVTTLYSTVLKYPWTSAAIAGVAAGAVIAYAIYEADTAVKQLRKSIEESMRLGEQAAQQRADLFKRMLGEMEGMTPAGKKDFLGQQIERTKQDIDGLNRAIAETQRQADEAGKYLSKWSPPAWMAPGVAGGSRLAENMLPNKALDMIQEQLRVQQAALDDARKAMKGYEEQLKSLSAVQVNQKLAKDIAELNKRLEEQIATFGMSGAEIEIWKLKMAGATEAQLQGARAAQWTLKFLTDQQKKFEDLQQEQKRLMDAGKQMTKEVATPAEVLKDRLEEIEKVFAAGGLNMETYFRLIAKAQDDFAKATNGSAEAVHTLSTNLGNLQGVLFGSAEALSLIRAQEDSFRRPLAAAQVGFGQPNVPALEQRGNPAAGIANDATLKEMLVVLKDMREQGKDRDKKGGLFNLKIL